ncbi:MAG: hypothetical protein ACI84E_001829 [Planctomycetota bacterium]|jgi:hypothetical protein
MLTSLLLLPLLLSLPGAAAQDSKPTSQPVQGNSPPVEQAEQESKEQVPPKQEADATGGADETKGTGTEVTKDEQTESEAALPLPKSRPGPRRLLGGQTIRLKPKATVERAQPVATADAPAAGQPSPETTPAKPEQAPEQTPKVNADQVNADEARTDEAPDATTPGKPDSPFDRNPFLTGPLDPFATLVAGALPPRTTPAAAKLWSDVVKAAKADTDAGTAPRAPITSFELQFEITVRDTGGGHNEATTKVRYLAPSFVRFQLEEITELGFGPDGYWSKDKDQPPVDISRREYAESKRRVQDVRTTAKNFLALAEPGNLRIVNLAKVQAPPTNQPPGAAKRLANLDWLVLESPDFDLSAGTAIAADAGSRLYRAYIGVGKTSHHVEEAMVIEVKDGEVRPATATWLTMGHRTMLDGISFPGSILIRRAVLAESPWTFTKRPTDELYLIEGKLVTDLVPADFLAK